MKTWQNMKFPSLLSCFCRKDQRPAALDANPSHHPIWRRWREYLGSSFWCPINFTSTNYPGSRLEPGGVGVGGVSQTRVSIQMIHSKAYRQNPQTEIEVVVLMVDVKKLNIKQNQQDCNWERKNETEEPSMSPEEKQLLSWKHTSVLVSEFLTLCHWVCIFLINGVLYILKMTILTLLYLLTLSMLLQIQTSWGQHCPIDELTFDLNVRGNTLSN